MQSLSPKRIASASRETKKQKKKAAPKPRKPIQKKPASPKTATTSHPPPETPPPPSTGLKKKFKSGIRPLSPDRPSFGDQASGAAMDGKQITTAKGVLEYQFNSLLELEGISRAMMKDYRYFLYSCPFNNKYFGYFGVPPFLTIIYAIHCNLISYAIKHLTKKAASS